MMNSHNGRHLLRHCAVLLTLVLIGGCASSIENMMFRNTGDVMQGFSKKHTTPYLLEQSDTGMSCAMAEATAPMMMSFGRVTDSPEQLGIMMQMSAANCSEERAREDELAYLRHMHNRRPVEARDAQYASQAHYIEAADRFYRSWWHLNRYYGDVGKDGSCPSDDLFATDMDEFMYMSGLLAGLQATNAQVRSSVNRGIPTNILGRVERAAQCLDNDKWWGVPMAMRAVVWSMVPSTMPDLEDPFKRLEEADRKGEEAGVRVSHVMHAMAAYNAEDHDQVKAVIRRHVESLDERRPAMDWVMVDRTATLNLKAISDRLWTTAEGHRTPTGQLGRFWDDVQPERESVDMDDLL